ncbi:hypothetical protein BKA63DRAFT_493599 [Paraphoma chrysanthemicola]|nr:hypothetical protein BKA63DRAFT_493599 [Paraphoma chrysanthemicola]
MCGLFHLILQVSQHMGSGRWEHDSRGLVSGDLTTPCLVDTAIPEPPRCLMKVMRYYHYGSKTSIGFRAAQLIMPTKNANDSPLEDLSVMWHITLNNLLTSSSWMILVAAQGSWSFLRQIIDEGQSPLQPLATELTPNNPYGKSEKPLFIQTAGGIKQDLERPATTLKLKFHGFTMSQTERKDIWSIDMEDILRLPKGRCSIPRQIAIVSLADPRRSVNINVRYPNYSSREDFIQGLYRAVPHYDPTKLRMCVKDWKTIYGAGVTLTEAKRQLVDIGYVEDEAIIIHWRSIWCDMAALARIWYERDDLHLERDDVPLSCREGAICLFLLGTTSTCCTSSASIFGTLASFSVEIRLRMSQILEEPIDPGRYTNGVFDASDNNEVDMTWSSWARGTGQSVSHTSCTTVPHSMRWHSISLNEWPQPPSMTTKQSPLLVEIAHTTNTTRNFVFKYSMDRCETKTSDSPSYAIQT